MLSASSISAAGEDRDNDLDGSAAMECTAPVVLQSLEQSHDPAWLPASASAQGADEQSQAQLPSTQQPPWRSGQRGHAGHSSPGSPHASRAAEHSKQRAQSAGCDDRMDRPAQEVMLRSCHCLTPSGMLLFRCRRRPMPARTAAMACTCRVARVQLCGALTHRVILSHALEGKDYRRAGHISVGADPRCG